MGDIGYDVVVCSRKDRWQRKPDCQQQSMVLNQQIYKVLLPLLSRMLNSCV